MGLSFQVDDFKATALEVRMPQRLHGKTEATSQGSCIVRSRNLPLRSDFPYDDNRRNLLSSTTMEIKRLIDGC